MFSFGSGALDALNAVDFGRGDADLGSCLIPPVFLYVYARLDDRDIIFRKGSADDKAASE
jgi:hypothetical protein